MKSTCCVWMERLIECTMSEIAKMTTRETHLSCSVEKFSESVVQVEAEGIREPKGGFEQIDQLGVLVLGRTEEDEARAEVQRQEASDAPQTRVAIGGSA